VPLLTSSVVVGVVFLVAIALLATVSTRVSPHEAFVDGAAVIGVVAFLLALPALGYAVRTDAAVANLDAEAKGDIFAARIDKEEELSIAPGAAPPDTLPVGSPKGVIKVRGLLYEIRSPQDVPPRVLNDLLMLGARVTGLKPGSIVAKLDYAARASARESVNAPWLFGLEDRDELWRLSYRGEGNNEPNLRLLGVATDGGRGDRQDGEVDSDVRETLIDVAAASQSLHDEIDALRRFFAASDQNGQAMSRRPSFSDALNRASALGVSQERVERVARELRGARLLQFNEPLDGDTKLILTVPRITSN
jgi:hypothetical protein